ncbi:MAG: hypothetical protein ACSW8K_02375, partial [bacterium]
AEKSSTVKDTAASKGAFQNTTAGLYIYSDMALYNGSEDVLILAGLDPEKMEYLPAAERKKLLEDAGLNPLEFDF